MYRRPLIALAVSALLAAPAAVAAEGGLAGRVSSRSTPLAAATVYAYGQAGHGFVKVATDAAGSFEFDSLSAGLFRVIAHKPGFLPAVVLVTRTSAEISQHLEMQLQPEQLGDVREGEDFWSLREQIPGDVLRDIQLAELERLRHVPSDTHSSLTTVMSAMAGVAESAGEAIQVAGGSVGIKGHLGGVEIDLTGDFERRAAEAVFNPGESPASGQFRSLNLAVNGRESARVAVSTLNLSTHLAASRLPLDFAQHQLQWQQEYGEKNSSRVSAQYVEENGFYSSGTAPAGIADASRTLNLEGIWATRFGRSVNLETGVRYREQEGFDQGGTLAIEDQWLQAFGRGDWQIQPTVLVEYGLYTSLRDGTLSLAPRGGLVVRLGEAWQVGGRASYRLSDEEPWHEVATGLRSAFYSGDEACDGEEDQCYQVFVSRKGSGGKELQVGAVHREFNDTLRLYFDENVFQHLDSVFLVRGDQLPELRFAMSRQLTPRILANLRSSVGSGGGGLLYLTDEKPYTNDIRYLVASLDTRFQATSTGVFLAFHHLEQEFEPLDGEPTSNPHLDLDRLQLMLTQDLNVLADLAADWAVQLNLEMRREATAPMDSFVLEEDPDIERRITGALAVRF